MRPTGARRSIHADAGFTLIEALVGLLMLAALVVGVSDLLVVSLGALRDARTDTSATFVAIQRLEALVAAVESGVPVVPSPTDALETDTTGFSDTVDAAGDVGGSHAAYRRRWRVRPLPSDPGRGWVLEVRVLTLQRAGSGPAIIPSARRAGDVLLATMRHSE